MNRVAWGSLAIAAGCMGPWPGDRPSDTDSAADSTASPSDPSAAFVYIGAAGAYGWSRSHDLGRLAAEEALGIATVAVEGVRPPEVRSAIEGLAADGHAAIVSTAHEFDRDAQDVARDLAATTVLQYDGATPDTVNYSGRMYQALWLAGILAGHTTTTDHVGVVSTVPNPETVRHVAAFTLGVRSVRPDAVVEVGWVLDFVDPIEEENRTLALIAHGADVILAQTDSPTPIDVADGVVATIAYHNADGCAYGPQSCLVSAYWNWGPLYTELLGDLAAGKLVRGGLRWERFLVDRANSVVALSDFEPSVPPTVAQQVHDEILAIEGRPLAWPFVGPLTDVNGATLVPDGVVVADEDLLQWCTLVAGVVSWDGAALVPGTLPTGCGGPPPNGRR